MFKRFIAFFGGLDGNDEILLQLFLTDKIAELLRAQGQIQNHLVFFSARFDEAIG